MPIKTHPGRFKRALFSLLGDAGGRNFLAHRVRKCATDLGPFTFPIDGASFERVLLILPADRVQALYQIENVTALIARFPDARITLLAETAVKPLAAMTGCAEVIEYLPEEKRLFAPAFTELCNQFRNEVDFCCLLTRDRDVPLLYLTGLTGARLRVGYRGAADFPFINLRIDSDADHRYLPESNCAMAEALGAQGGGVWNRIEAGSTSADIDQHLREVRLDGVSRLVGIDALSMFRLFGEKGAEECISALMTSADGSLYFYCEEEPRRAIAGRLSAMVPPLFSALTLPQTIALLRRTECIVAGYSLLFGLATLLGKKAVGVFSEEDLPLYCKPSSTMRGISCFGKGANAEAPAAMVAAIRELLCR